MYLGKNKKGVSFLGVIFGVLLLTFVLIILLDPLKLSGKTMSQISKDTLDSSKACAGLQDGKECKLAGQNGLCKDYRCVLDINIPSNEAEAIAVFRTHLKEALTGCLADSEKCDQATQYMKNIISYSNTKDEGLVFIVIDNYNTQLSTMKNTRSVWKIYNRAGGFLGLRGAKSRASWEFPGGRGCLLLDTKDKQKDIADGEDNLKNAQLGLGKDPKGYAVLDFSNFPKTVKTFGQFVSFEKHMKGEEPIVCIHAIKE